MSRLLHLTKPPTLIAFAISWLLASSALAAGDPNAGAELVSRDCSVCHLRDVTPRSPNDPLSFREIVRKHGFTRDEMHSFLRKAHYPMPPRALSTSEIEDLIAHFDELGYWP